jgi:hypothetical protein
LVEVKYVATGGEMGRHKLDWRNVDWTDILSSTTAGLVGGRIGVAIQAAIKIWSQLGSSVNEKIGGELERSVIASDTPKPDEVAGPLGLEETEAVALEFILVLLKSWHESNVESFSDYVRTLSSNVWANARDYRKTISQAIYDPEEIRIVCRDAGLDMARISLQGSAERQWFTVFEYLRTQPPGLVLLLLYNAAQRAPNQNRFRVWESR